MAGKVAEIQGVISRDRLAAEIGNMFDRFNIQRRGWLQEKKELRNYIFATDTSSTTNRSLPWKNSTTLPKICQIRDNLHANYQSALFPNEEWAKWLADTEEDAAADKRKAVTAYITNKVRESDLKEIVSQLLYDYIDYGNAFAEIVWKQKTFIDEETGEEHRIYVGPALERISPLDIVFNPTAPSFDESPKIRRYIKTLGEVKLDAEQNPEKVALQEAVEYLEDVRNNIGHYKATDVDKAGGFSVDGFGSLQEYYQSGYVEFLEFEGTIYNPHTNKMMMNRRITIVDRSFVAGDEQMPSWFGTSYKIHVGWRKRPDNLYAMGPLDNLIGLQYRLDHVENAKADAMDLAIHPPLKVHGNVEEFVWGPGEIINCGDDGNVDEIAKNLNAVLTAQNEIAQIEQRMEELAGAPKQAMGIRTPGEKTAFEVQSLENASWRIFQEKIDNFEKNIVEKALNMYLELSRRNMDVSDVVSIIDDELGVQEFMTVTKDDITAKGKIRAIGSRHFAARAQLIQNIMGIMNSAIGQKIDPHTSSLSLATLVEELFGLEKRNLFRANVGVEEQFETQRLISELQGQLAEQEATPGVEGLE
jgi:hypothetical protein